MLNPQNATITLEPPTATQFRLKYLSAGATVAELLVSANYVTASQYVQPLDELNQSVPAQNQGGDMTLTASALNEGGESAATACAETIQVENAPNAPTSVTVS